MDAPPPLLVLCLLLLPLLLLAGVHLVALPVNRRRQL
jgi:hypothetical protein